MCGTYINIACLPVIPNFALVLISQIVFQRSSSEKHVGVWHLALEAVDFTTSQAALLTLGLFPEFPQQQL